MYKLKIMKPFKRIVWSLIIPMSCFYSCAPKATVKQSVEAFSNEGYKLVWADEFNKDGALDANNWHFEKGFARNHELQWFQQDNAFCKNGLLVIEALKEQKPNPN